MDTFVKFRIRQDQKKRLSQAAFDADMSVSALVRRAALATAEGRTLSRDSRIDLIAMRVAANELAAALEASSDNLDATMLRMRAAAATLHRLASRQLAAQ